VKVRVTYVLERGSHAGLVKHAVEGEVLECDRVEFQHGALILWRRVPLWKQEVIDQGGQQQWVEELVKAYGPGTYRTVVPLPVGAGDQPVKATDENPPRRAEEARPDRTPQVR